MKKFITIALSAILALSMLAGCGKKSVTTDGSTSMEKVIGALGEAYQAKTGTAQIGSGSSNGAFICFAPADNPKIAIAVYGEKVDGGSYLAPVAKAILDTYFGMNSGDVDIIENQVG